MKITELDLSDYSTGSKRIGDYLIGVSYSDYADNPLIEWDCMPPGITYFENKTEYGDLPCLYSLLDAKWHKLKSDLWVGEATLHDLQKEYAKEYACGMNEAREQIIYDFVDNEISFNNFACAGESLEIIEQILNANSIETANGTSKGYSQGDSTQYLFAATPEFLKKTGIKKGQAKGSLESVAKLYGYWAWGDVYHAQVSKVTGCDCCGHESAEVVASCGGFYGPHDESGIIEFINESLESEAG